MPYDTIADLPDSLKNLPKGAKEIYLSAYNTASKDNDEASSAAIAWTAVKAKYKKANERWVAKESNGNMSDEDKRDLLSRSLIAKHGLNQDRAYPSGAWIEEVFDDSIIYKFEDNTYKMSFTINEDNEVVFGEPIEVKKKTSYEPIEALRKQYHDIIQEVGRRNANLDSSRIRKILQLCQELLSSEEDPDDKKVAKAAKEAESVLAWLNEQEIMKVEEDAKYPASAYAYVPDSALPDNWQLRIWEDPDKKTTKTQLGKITASLSPGGFSGKKAQIPVDDLPAVKRRIRTEFRSLGIEDEDIPKWVSEKETREFLNSYMPLTEAKIDKGRASVIVIKPGFNASEDRYYPAEMLKRDYGIFEGQKMYADHPTDEEDKARPERSIRDWVATLSEVKCDEAGVVTGIAEILEPWLMQKLASLREKEMLSDMGISINAVGSATKATVDGKETLVIEKLVAARSVDFVTEPGAGGIVTFYESDKKYDIDLVDLSTLKEKRPDLVKSIETKVKNEITREVKKAMEDAERIKELETENESLKTKVTEMETKATEAEKEKAKAEAQAAIKEAVDKAELPDAAKAKLLERFKDAETSEGIEEAITAEKEYIAKLAEAGKVKNLGPSQTDSAKETEALTESLKRAHPDWTEEQLAEAVRG